MTGREPGAMPPATKCVGKEPSGHRKHQYVCLLTITISVGTCWNMVVYLNRHEFIRYALHEFCTSLQTVQGLWAAFERAEHLGCKAQPKNGGGSSAEMCWPHNLWELIRNKFSKIRGIIPDTVVAIVKCLFVAWNHSNHNFFVGGNIVLNDCHPRCAFLLSFGWNRFRNLQLSLQTNAC